MKSSILSPLADVVFRQNCRNVVHAFGPTLRRTFGRWVVDLTKTDYVLRFQEQVRSKTRGNTVVTYHTWRVTLFGLTCQRVFHQPLTNTVPVDHDRPELQPTSGTVELRYRVVCETEAVLFSTLFLRFFGSCDRRNVPAARSSAARDRLSCRLRNDSSCGSGFFHR